jgi:type IV secretion system protein VirD4
VGTDETDLRHATERRTREARFQLNRQTADAKRSIDDAKRAARREIDQRVRDAKASAGGGSSFFGLGTGSSTQNVEDQLLVWALPVAAVALVPLVVGHLAALLVSGGWPSYPISEAPGIVGRFATNPGDPAEAWAPVNTGAPVPGPAAWWGTFVLVAVVAGLVGLLVWSMARPAGGARSGWARPEELRDLRVARKDDDRLVVGTSGGHKLALRDRHSLLVVGPAHSGKSCGLTIPAIAEWRGPVVVASTKGHVIDETIGWRSRQGEVHVYDPAAITPYYRSGWSLLAECATWQGAIRTAADLTLAARGAGVSDGPERAIGDGQGDLWRSSMSMALAPFLLAAVSSGQTVSVAAEWIEREERDEVLTILQGVDRMAARTHASTFMREDASRSAFLHAMHQVLRVYDDPVVASSMDLHEIVPEELLDGGANSLYLTTPEHDQARFRPLCSMIVRRLIATAYQQSANSGAALGSPLLVVLDDVLGIAPIYDLASLASTAPARGVQLVSVFQDTDQIITRYGENADNVIRNHGAKLVLAGRPAGRPFAADLVATELTDQLGAWEAALLYGSGRPARVRLRPWFRDRELKRRVQTPQDVVKPAEGSASRESRPSSDQASVWLRRGPVRPPEGTDPTIPLDRHAPGYVEVFGSLDDDTAPQNVTPMPGSHWRGGGS